MAQTTDYEIANSSGLVFRGRVNEVLAAVQSSNSGTTAPTDTAAGMLWFDTSVTPAILRRRNAADSAWINVYSTEDLASQAEAEAGSNNTKLMTPLRVAQAIDAQISAVNSMTLLGTLNTTSGTTQTLSGLDLTVYNVLYITYSGVSFTFSREMLLGGIDCSASTSDAAGTIRGYIRIDLNSSVQEFGSVASGGTPDSNSRLLSPYNKSSTSITFSINGSGNFDAGSILVYGVK